MHYFSETTAITVVVYGDHSKVKLSYLWPPYVIGGHYIFVL